MLDQTTVVDATAKIIARQEQELITRAKSGDRAAFQQIYLQYHKRVFGICFRMLADKEVAEDVTQEVFIQLWQKLDNFRGESKFSTWLHSVATNTVLGHLRKHKNWLQKVFSIEEQSPYAEASAEMPELSNLDQLILKLPERARMVFVLFAVEGYRHEEISSMMGMAVGSSKAQYHRARQLLQEWID